MPDKVRRGNNILKAITKQAQRYYYDSNRTVTWRNSLKYAGKDYREGKLIR